MPSPKPLDPAYGVSPEKMKKLLGKKISSTKPKVSASKPSLKSPSKTSKSPMPKKATGEAAARQYQKEISPKGMASASAANKKAIDKKYPGLYKSATPKPKKK